MCQDVALEGTFLVAGVLTLVAAERLFPSMNKNVLFQITSCCEREGTWGQKAAYIRRNLPMVERVFKILKLIVISPHDSIKCQSWEGFEKIAFYHYKKAHFYTVGQNQLF